MIVALRGACVTLLYKKRNWVSLSRGIVSVFQCQNTDDPAQPYWHSLRLETLLCVSHSEPCQHLSVLTIVAPRPWVLVITPWTAYFGRGHYFSLHPPLSLSVHEWCIVIGDLVDHGQRTVEDRGETGCHNRPYWLLCQFHSSAVVADVSAVCFACTFPRFNIVQVCHLMWFLMCQLGQRLQVEETVVSITVFVSCGTWTDGQS